MTFEDDHIRLKFTTGRTETCFCQKCGIDWPPPEIFESNLGKFKLVRRSQISDEDRAYKLSCIAARGAEYIEIE